MRDLIPLTWAILVPRPSRLARLLLAVLLLCFAPACMSWRIRPTPEPRTATPRYLEYARVTADNGDMMVLHDVWVTQDSVVGWRGRGVGGGLTKVRLARSQVLIFEVRRFNAVGTVAAIGATLAAIWAGLVYYNGTEGT
jgi:hypothetical protein